MRRRIDHLILAIAFAVALAPAPGASSAGEGKIRRNPNAIKDEYIVVLNDDVERGAIPALAARLAKQYGGDVKRTWQDALKGFHVKMTEGQAQGLSHHPDVKYIEENAEMFLSASAPTNVDPACDPSPGVTCTTTDNRLWHLDVLDQNSALATNDYSYCETGSGVYVYEIDTGVMRAHREFNNDANKILNGYDATGEGSYFPPTDPCHGFALDQPDGPLNVNAIRGGNSHGTGVASLITGRNMGVARDAKVVPIKVLPCGQYGVKKMGPDAFNRFYALNDLVWANSAVFKVVQAGFTGANGTYPSTGWPFPPQGTPACCQQWGDVRIEYVGSLGMFPTPTITTAYIIEALDWILRPASQGGNPNPKSPAVVTLSTYALRTDDGVTSPLPGGTLSMEDAVGNLLKYNNGQGITVVASANNQDANACDSSPGRMSRGNPNNPNDPAHPYKVITAGGTMIRNNPDANPATGGGQVDLPEPIYDATKATRLARWRCWAGDSDGCSANIYSNPPPVTPDFTAGATQRSNYIGWTLGSNGGRCVTLFAPAKNIPVASLNDFNTYRNSRGTNALASGTSWSAPIVASMAARILQGNTTYTVDQVYDALMARTTPDLDPTELDPPGVTCPNDGQPCTTNKVLRMTPVVVQPLPVRTTVATSGNTSLSITASGAAGLTYELYQVNASFDVATYNTGAAASTRIAAPQTSNVFSVPSTIGVSYFARVRSSCGTADTNITTLASALTPPTGVNAVASGAVVTISWNAVSGATGYKVERKIGTAAWETAQTVTSGSQTSVSDSPTVPTGVVLYRVLATQNSAPASDPSNNDVAYTKSFTDDPILTVAPYTTIKAKHLVEVRQAVNALRELAGAGAIYLGNDLDENYVKTQTISASDFTTLMGNLNTARGGVSLSNVGFQITPAIGGLIDDTQMSDLRAGVK